MPKYSYIARDRSSRVLRGQAVANSPIELRSRLSALELQLVSYDSLSSVRLLDLLKAANLSQWLPVRSIDIELAMQQLAIMLRSGLRLLDALKALEMQAERKSMARLLEKIHTSIANGSALSDALASQSKIPPIVVQLVRVGEHSGNLDMALEQSKEYLSRRRTMITELFVAISYPFVVTSAAILVAAYLVVIVIPQLKTFLSAMGRDLPRMTQSLIDLSNWMRLNGASIVLGVVGSMAALAVLMYWPRGRLVLDRCLLRLPLIGETLRLSATAGLASSLATMLQSGIRLVEALRIATGMQRNRYLASLLRGASYSVAGGNPLSPSLALKDGFSPVLSSMVEVAERTGKMESAVSEVANLCDAQLKSKIKRMSRLVEPMVIILAGGIVGYVYIAFFLALMSAGGGIR